MLLTLWGRALVEHTLRPKSNASLLYNMQKTLGQKSSVSEYIVFEKQ